MRVAIVVGALVLAIGPASGAYIVELDDGDRMTVDSCWEDGDDTHLVRDGVDLRVRRGRIHSLKEIDNPPPKPVRREPAAAVPPSPGASSSREKLEARQSAIDRHLLRVQQARFEAEARGEDARKLKRLGKEFRRTQERRRDTAHALERIGGEP